MIMFKRTIAMMVTTAVVGCAMASAPAARLYGPFGDRLNKMIANHVESTDVDMLTRVFSQADSEGTWRTEFWGKYMHSACPYAEYTGSPTLRAKLDKGIDALLAAQEPCGYLGGYSELADGPRARFATQWDIWGIKYTLMGLLHYYDLKGGDERRERALLAARRLCDHLISKVGPNGTQAKSILTTGSYAGLPSSSVLEPVMWLYRRTNEPRYLNYAAYIVKELTENPEGPQFVKNADKPVADWRIEVVPERLKNAKPVYFEAQLTKAYEFMSCCQGLLEYAEVAGRQDLLKAVKKIAHHIVEEEINLAGGSASGEHWYHGATLQYQRRSSMQETCVLTTWMRLCEKLGTLTDDPFWMDQLEKTFYGAYLGAMNLECNCFAAYTPMVGYRSIGHEHCRMHTNCCNANGPRGYLAMLNRLFVERGDEKTFNFYMSAAVGDFTLYSSYPRQGDFEIGYRGKTARHFRLRLRIPAFANKTKITIKRQWRTIAKHGDEIKAGTYFTLDREWQPSDVIRVEFDMPVVMHRLDNYVAFTRGPLCLARDSRFADGALDEEIDLQAFKPETLAGFASVRPPDPTMYMATAATLPAGSHLENVYGQLPSTIHFTDYASAGNLWRDDNRYRVWLPVLIRGRQY